MIIKALRYLIDNYMQKYNSNKATFSYWKQEVYFKAIDDLDYKLLQKVSIKVSAILGGLDNEDIILVIL
jgi:hypothetical protein